MSPKRSKRTKQQVVPEKVTLSPAAKKKKPVQSFKIYLHAVLNQVHPSLRISTRAMNIMNTFMFDIFERIDNELAGLVTKRLVYNKAIKKKSQTLSSRDVEFAVKLLLPGELSKHAISEGTKAVRLYNRSKLNEGH